MDETFKQRMKRLRKRAGLDSQQAAATAIGCERGTVGMWEAPSSRVDAVGGEYLMDVARAYQVRPEYLNSGKGDDGFPWSPGDASQPVILDPDSIREVMRLLDQRYKATGGFRIRDMPEVFALAYKLYAETADAAAPDNAVEFGMRLADLTPQGAPHNERKQKMPGTGTTGKTAGAGRGRNT